MDKPSEQFKAAMLQAMDRWEAKWYSLYQTNGQESGTAFGVFLVLLVTALVPVTMFVIVSLRLLEDIIEILRGEE